MTGETVSVLLPVHVGVAAGDLRAALDSLDRQTRPADEVVIVQDGPLTPAHDGLLDRYVASRPGVVRLALPTNQGAGIANQTGLEAATGTWIAKMDADDLLLPHRFETQLEALHRTGADLCGAAMWEFDNDPSQPTRLRANPADHDAIARRMRFNNPVNHPTAVYRRSLALEVGGYPSMRFMQDYDLFARMLRRRRTDDEPPRAAGALPRRRRDAARAARPAATSPSSASSSATCRSYGLVGRGRAARQPDDPRRLPCAPTLGALARLRSVPVHAGS